MVRNEDYFGGSRGKAKIGTVKFRTIVDPETQLAEMMTGGIDWIWDVPKEKAEQLEMMPQVTVVNADTMRVSYIGMDAAGRGGDHPFTKLKVRRAGADRLHRGAVAHKPPGGGATGGPPPCKP